MQQDTKRLENIVLGMKDQLARVSSAYHGGQQSGDWHRAVVGIRLVTRHRAVVGIRLVTRHRLASSPRESRPSRSV